MKFKIQCGAHADRLDYLVRLKLLPTAGAKTTAACRLGRELLKVENPWAQLHVSG